LEIEEEYIRLKKELDELIAKKESDPVLTKLSEEIDELRNKKMELEGLHDMAMMPIANRINEIEKEFLSMYDGQKTLPLEKLVLTFRTTKKFNVLNKEAIVDTLMKIGQVGKGVKSFALKHLRSLAEAEVLPEGSYEWDETVHVSVKEKGEK